MRPGLALALTLVLAACSGGGGGTRPPAEPRPGPGSTPAASADAAPTETTTPGPDPQYMEPLQLIVGNFELPNSLDVSVDDCGATDARYDPNIPQIMVCTELIASLGAEHAHLAFHHQLGHALIHLLELPTTGPEEVAVDELATLLAVHFAGPAVLDHLAAALAAVVNQPPQTRWSEDHALDADRARHMLCLIHGSDPAGRAAAAVPLAKGQAAKCPSTWKRVDGAWRQLLDIDIP